MGRKLAAIALIPMMLVAGSATAGINSSNLSGAKSKVKVLKAKAQNRLNKDGEGLLGDPCSQSLNAGNVIIPDGARAPREVVIVIEGDVTNVGSTFGNARCR